MNPDFDFAAARTALLEVERLTAYWDGEFYPLTAPTLAEDGFAAYQLAKADCGFAAIFRRELCAADSFTLQLAEIDRAAAYAVTVTDEHYAAKTATVSGAALADGYAVTLPEAHTSAIVEYSKMEG